MSITPRRALQTAYRAERTYGAIERAQYENLYNTAVLERARSSAAARRAGPSTWDEVKKVLGTTIPGTEGGITGASDIGDPLTIGDALTSASLAIPIEAIAAAKAGPAAKAVVRSLFKTESGAPRGVAAVARKATPTARRARVETRARNVAIAEQAEKGYPSLSSLRKYQAAQDAVRAGKSMRAVRATGRTAQKGWRSKPVRAARKGTKVATAPVRAPVRYSWRHPGQTFLGSSGAVGAVTASQSGKPEDLLLGPARVAKTTATATAEDPGAVGMTTLRVIPATATALAQLPGDVAAAAISGDTGPLAGQAKSFVDYYKMIAAVAQDKSYTTKMLDPETGREVEVTHTPEEIIQQDLGLVPLLTTGLLAKRALRGKGTAASIAHRERKLESIRRDLDSPDFQTRVRAEKKYGKLKAPLRERRFDKAQEKKRAASTDERINAGFALDMKQGGKRGSRLNRQLERLYRERLTDKVTVGDVVQFIGREGLVDAAQARTRIAEIRRDLRDPSKPVDRNTVATRDVLDALDKHPEAVGRVQTFLDGWGKYQREVSVQRHTERTGKRQTTPDPEDERARLMAQGRAEGILTPEERIRPELRGHPALTRPVTREGVATPKIRERVGHDADKQIRGEATSLRKRAARFTTQAAAMRRTRPDRAAALEGKAAGLVRQADELEVVVKRQQRARGLDTRALKAEKAGDARAAYQMRREAQEMRHEDTLSQRQLRDEFIAEVETKRAEVGKRPAIYFREADAADRGALNVMTDYPGGRLGSKEKKRLGVLAKEGRIDEAAATLLEGAYRNRVGMEMRKHVKSFVDDGLISVEGKKIRTGDEWRALETDLPPGTALIPVHEFMRAMQRGEWDEAAGLIANPLRAELRESRPAGGRRYGAVSEARLKEFRAQMKPYGDGLRIVRNMGRVQSIAMLAGSVPWFAYQLIASPLAAVVAHPNPVAWTRAMKKATADWKHLDPYEKVEFQSHYGSTSADAISLQRQVTIGLEAGTTRNMHTAAGVALRSPAGRAMNAIWQQMRNGGPLISANRKYEAKVRDLVALIEMDKQIRHPKQVMRFAGSVGGLHNVVVEHMRQLKDKPLAEQVRFYNENPQARTALAEGLDDALGNWNALAHNERIAAATTVFYPFLRFSLRWLFHSMPTRHPLTSAVLINLGQKNANELKYLMGGAPSFFPDWGNIVLHTGEDGKPGMTVDIARVAPGSNALIEALGQGGFTLPALFAPFQPILKTLATAAAGQDPMSGRESSKTKGELIARGIVGLSPLTRSMARDIGEQTVYSQLFQRITGRSGNFLSDVLPHPVTDPARDREAQYASKLMAEAFGATGEESSQARAKLGDLLEKYGLERPDYLGGGESPSSSSSTGPSSPTRSFGWSSGSSSGGSSGSSGRSFSWAD